MSIESNLTGCGSWFGKRTKKARNSDDGDVIAAAAMISMLCVLRANANERPLTPDDLQIVIDAACGGAQVEERESRMGALFYCRIGAPQEVGDF